MPHVELTRDDTLNRLDGRVEPGLWRPVTVDGKPSAIVSCPGCGVVATLDHEVWGDGIVHPSLVCPESCGFHDFVRLLGWKPA